MTPGQFKHLFFVLLLSPSLSVRADGNDLESLRQEGMQRFFALKW
jgi:hypothetical protein